MINDIYTFHSFFVLCIVAVETGHKITTNTIEDENDFSEQKSKHKHASIFSVIESSSEGEQLMQEKETDISSIVQSGTESQSIKSFGSIIYYQIHILLYNYIHNYCSLILVDPYKKIAQNMAKEIDTLKKNLSEKEGISFCDVGVQFSEITPMTGDLFHMTDVFLILLLIHLFRSTTWSFNCWPEAVSHRRRQTSVLSMEGMWFLYSCFSRHSFSS